MATVKPRRKRGRARRRRKKKVSVHTTVKSVKPYRMPSPTRAEVQKIVDAVESLPPRHRRQAVALMNEMGPKQLCLCLHGMRRWYSGQTAKKHILRNRDALLSAKAMDLRPPIGAYRGFKVDKRDRIASMDEGDVVRLPVTRNHGVSSWTASRQAANRFSGASKGKVGVVVKCRGPKSAKTFIAPPKKSAAWFNALYDETMGRAFRHTEDEFTIQAPAVEAEIVALKR